MHITAAVFHAILCVFIFISLVPKSTARKKSHKKRPPSNFAFVKYNEFEQRELRIAYEGILALETCIFQNTEDETILLQITNGRRVVQLIHQDGILKDCESTENSKSILQFVQAFMLPEDFVEIEDHGNVFKLYNMTTTQHTSGVDALRHFSKRSFLGPFTETINIKHAKRMCHRLYKQRRRLAKQKQIDDGQAKYRKEMDVIRMVEGANSKNRRRNFEKSMSSAEELGLSSEDIHGLVKDGLRHLGDIPKEKSQQEPTDSHELNDAKNRMDSTGDGLLEQPLDTAHRKLSRRKRSLFENLLIHPGTKWCGRGDIALSNNDLGTDREADICCRDHDLCKEVILPFTTRYNVFNYRIHSLVSCKCDERLVFHIFLYKK